MYWGFKQGFIALCVVLVPVYKPCSVLLIVVSNSTVGFRPWYRSTTHNSYANDDLHIFEPTTETSNPLSFSTYLDFFNSFYSSPSFFPVTFFDFKHAS